MQRFYTGTVTSEKYEHALDRMADLFRDMEAENAALREQVPRWIPANESKPKQGDRVLLKIKWEDCPVVGYWGTGRWEACTVNHEVSCSSYCYGGMVDGNFKSEEVTHYLPLPPPPAEEG